MTDYKTPEQKTDERYAMIFWGVLVAIVAIEAWFF